METKRIPVTIITGFLGAGKTTLLNNLIKKYSDKKFAVIENEFGEIGIDGGLIVGADDNIFELANGCICCSLNNDFQNVLFQLLSGDYEFNHLLIETTGIADPDTIIQPFISSPRIQQYFELDSVIALADAINLEDMLDEQPEVRKQLAVSDIVLLNKTDSVRNEYAQEVQTMIKTVAPSVQIYPVAFANISEIEILDTFLYSGKAVEKFTIDFQNVQVVNNYNSTHEHHHHHHDIKTEGFAIPGGFDYEKFSFWIQNYVFYNQKNVFRIKGILSFEGMEKQYIFHSVRSDYLVEEGKTWDTDMRFSKLIFIGKNIDRDKLEDSLYELLA